ncbi:GTP binding protein [Histoplasma capsulatum H143]|uniref:GTP binding protein n=1 Tax=Ajellomyces capsulatus (strain H143) TaxID=544712 RepID=C6HKP9_AJECH|nr:GTP binding protein [Histoplasma capsulatum H143]
MIPDTTSTPTIGLMRLQFWRDTITRTLAGQPPKEPIAILLASALSELETRTGGQARISKGWFLRMINSREQYLTNTPYTSISALESYAENTYSTLLYLTLSALPLTSVTADHLASHIGKAAGISTVLRGIPLIAFPAPPSHHSNQPGGLGGGAGGGSGARVGTITLPLDVMAETGLKEEDIFRHGAEAPGLRDAVFTVATPPSDSGYSTVSQVTTTEDHAELDILDQLGLSDNTGQVELKQLLLDDSTTADDTLQQLAGVVQARLGEGRGETIFDLGQEDNGDWMGFNKAQWDTALERLRRAAQTLRADCKVLLTYNVGGPEEVESKNERIKHAYGKILIRQAPASPEDVIETRIAVVGNVDAGKSTLLGVLVKGKLDDGRGRARINLFRHKHEIESGRTSSVGMEIMGFDTHGEIVGRGQGRKQSWEEIGRQSAKVISFTDLAGHERYLRAGHSRRGFCAPWKVERFSCCSKDTRGRQ